MNYNRWWEDQSYLRSMGISSYPDHMLDATQFAYQDYRAIYSNSDLQNEYITANELMARMQDAQKRYEKSRDDYVQPGPTNAELRHPSVRAAYDELRVIMKLAKGSRYEKD